MSTIRQPAAAGRFYPGEKRVLQAMVQDLLDIEVVFEKKAKAIIAPHAGYIYSGPTAAVVYKCLEAYRDSINHVILLGPSHYVHLDGLALSSAQRFATPLGDVPINQGLCETMLGLRQATYFDPAHMKEHSLEVQLPFLQVVLGEFDMVPMSVGSASPEDVAEVLDLLWGEDETLLVISSDLSHFHDYYTARENDQATADAILKFEPVYPFQACGCVGINGMVHVAKRRGMGVQMLDLRNSGDTAGPRDRVVGYGAFCFWEKVGAIAA